MKYTECRYVFVIKNNKCFKILEEIYTGPSIVSIGVRKQRPFGCGDMLAIRDDLQRHGMKWGEDFYVRKVKGKDIKI